MAVLDLQYLWSILSMVGIFYIAWSMSPNTVDKNTTFTCYREEGTNNIPPNAVSIIRHMKSVKHGNSAFTPWVFTVVTPFGMVSISRCSTWVFGATRFMVLLMIANANHVWGKCWIMLYCCHPLVPQISLKERPKEKQPWKIMVALRSSIKIPSTDSSVRLKSSFEIILKEASLGLLNSTIEWCTWRCHFEAWMFFRRQYYNLHKYAT